MILNEITIGGFRTYADRISVGPFDERITVIHAPNGTGKTTLLEGLYAGLLDSHAMSGVKAEAAMRSAGRDIAPSVTVDFTSDDRRFRVEKRFLNDGSAKLYECVDGTFTLVREGDGVTEFTRGLLHAAASKRGPSKYEEHFGLGAILWAPQGHTALRPMPDELLTTVRSRLSGESVPSGIDDAVETSIGRWFGTFYADTGKERTAVGSADVPALRTRVTDARDTLAKATAELAKIDEFRNAVENAAQDESRWIRECTTFDERLADLKGELIAFDAASAGAREADAAFQSANERHDNADKAIYAIERARTAVASAERAELERREALEALVATENAARARGEHASAAAIAASQALDAARARSSVASDARTFVAERRALARYGEQIAAAETFEKTVRELRDRGARILAPSPEQLKTIRSKHAAMEKLRVQLESSILRVTYTPSHGEGVALSAGAFLAGTPAPTGSPIEIAGSPFVAFAIEGAGTVRASGPTESSEALRERLTAAETAFGERTRPFGTTDLSELERRAGEAAGIENRLDALLSGVGANATSLKDLRMHLDAARAAVASLATRFPAWESADPDAESLSQAAASREADAREVHASAATALDVAQTNLSQATKARDKSRDAHAKAKSALDNAGGSLSALEDDGLDDDARTARRRDLGLELLRVTDRAETARTALAAFATDPREQYANLERTRDAAHAERQKAAVAGARSKALLDAQSVAGCYDGVSRAAASLAEAEERLHDAEREAAAAKLLHDVFAAVKLEREEQYLEPVRKRTRELYARVVNAPAADIRFTRDLELEGMMLGTTLLGATLSGGESEQLNMVARLALADLLNQGERQLVVLDDSLSVTDPRRFARFLGIVREFAQDRMQFVIATCDKARYLSLTEATFVDLEALRRPIALAS